MKLCNVGQASQAMRNLATLSVLVVATMLTGPVRADAEAEPVATIRTINLPPIAMTYRDLDSVLGDIGQIVQPDSKAKATDLSLSISGESESGEEVGLELHSWGKLLDAGNLPPVANSVSLIYRVSGSAPISRVEVMLHDSFRLVKLTGNDRVRVEAASAAIQSMFKNYYYTTPFAGVWLRVALFAIGALTFGTVITWASARIPAAHPWLIIAIYVGGFVGFLGLTFVPPWDRWLPGTAIYNDSASFLTRHQDAIGLIGLLLGLWPILQGIFTWARRKSQHVNGKTN
jgi:hypothetical protein